MPQPNPRPSSEPQRPASFEPEVFGKYFLVDRIAVGGMAEIFKAKTFGHGGFEKLLVVKRILSNLSSNHEFEEMFVDEAKVSATLQHANIVQTFEFGKIRENCFIAMECVEGKDIKGLLRKLAHKRRLLPIEFAVYVAHEAAKGLAYAHRKQDREGQDLDLVHRDMSPSNVLISYEGEVKIADFGIAKAKTNTYTTRDGVLKGKFEYMSPEQASGHDIDHRSDIFSLGIILYECLTGRRLFKAGSDLKTLEAIKACDIDPPSVHNPAVPARVDQIVMRALARRPDDRYQEAHEFQADLMEFLHPATPDLTRQSFAHFLGDVFAQEIADERRRLEEGTRRANEIHQQAPEVDLEPSWSDSAPGTLHTAGSRLPIVVVVGVMLLLLGGLAWVVFRPSPAPEPLAPPPLVALTGSATVEIDVPARVLVDEQPVGEGTRVEVRDLAAGEHMLRIEAAGFVPRFTTFRIAEGDRLRIAERLAPLPADGAEVSDPTAAEAAAGEPEAASTASSPSKEPGLIGVNVSRNWAHVWIDGQKLDLTTPLAKVPIEPGVHTVRVENEAFGIDATRQVTIDPGEVATVLFDLE